MSPSPRRPRAGSEASDGAPEVPQPPQAPDMPRRLQLWPLQRWGLPLLAMLPLLALIGLIGITQDRVTTAGRQLRLEVDFPSRTHTGVMAALTVTVWNLGTLPVNDVHVTLPRAYLESFDAFELRPPASTVSTTSYRVQVGTVPAGANRVVTALLTPGDYWRLPGTVNAGAPSLEGELTAEFSTFNFP